MTNLLPGPDLWPTVEAVSVYGKNTIVLFQLVNPCEERRAQNHAVLFPFSHLMDRCAARLESRNL